MRFTQLVCNVEYSFSLLYSISLYIHAIIGVHSALGRHLDSFQFGVSIKSDTVCILVHVFW